MEAMRPHMLLSKSTIKPSTQIPNRLPSINLTILDQLMPDSYMTWILFYPKIIENGVWTREKTVSLLQNSLSEALNHYYPFAGRLVERERIDCNDEGVDFLEAEIPSTLSSFLKNIEPKSMEMFDILRSPWDCSCNHSSPLVISVSYFECGGFAICTSVLHQVADGTTMTNFINYWALVARGITGDNVTLPEPPVFISSMFPPGPIKFRLPMHSVDKYVTQRFVFEPSKLSDLKAVVTEAGVSNPSRVEVANAVLLKCYLDAVCDDSNPPIFSQSVNMRSRTTPPMPKNSAGNFAWHYVSAAEPGNKLHTLIDSMKKGFQEFNDNYTRNVTPNDCFSKLCTSINDMINPPQGSEPKKDINLYVSSSTCGFVSYKIDFGWGKPVWAGICWIGVRNSTLLLDAATPGGIEAWVALKESEMEILQHNPELLSFATLNPNPITDMI